MNYKLAKELKDAGFPNSKEWVDEGDCFQDDVGYAGRKVPTLSELIEACGEDFDSLHRESDGWYVESIPTNLGLYSSPEEAVAYLWLALNKK